MLRYIIISFFLIVNLLISEQITGYQLAKMIDNKAQPQCPAFAQLVEDSGAGFAYLIFGGNCGIRMKLAAVDEPWSLESPNQWGESHLLLADSNDLVFLDQQNPSDGSLSPRIQEKE